MARWLKRGMDSVEISHAEAKVRETVQDIVRQVERRKETAVRELSKKFDNWEPKDFRLTHAQIESAVSKIPKRDLEDIKFAQAQMRNFASKQRESMLDVEVVLGHRHLFEPNELHRRRGHALPPKNQSEPCSEMWRRNMQRNQRRSLRVI